MNENEEFNERFENVEQALKYIADSQAKSEWLNKQDDIRSRERFERMEKLQEQTDIRLDRISQQLNHITQLTGFAFEELQFNDRKLKDAGEILIREKQL